MSKRQTKELLPLSDITAGFFKQQWGKSQGFAVKLWQEWGQFASTEVLQQTRPVGYQKGRLLLWVDGSTSLQELSFYTEELKNKINTHFGKEWVQSVHFTVDREILRKREQSIKLLHKMNI